MEKEKKFIKDLLGFYQNNLLAGYYLKRGKSLVIPNIVFCLDRLAKLKQKKIAVLDLGCGKGNLLKVVSALTTSLGLKDKVKFYGLDFDEDLINQAKQEDGHEITYYHRDLRDDLLEDLYGKFDLVISINTFHEIFSSFLQDGDNPTNNAKINSAKIKIAKLVKQVGKLLTKNGSLIFYDGLDLAQEEYSKPVNFKIKTEALAHNFNRFIREYSLEKLEYKKLGAKYYQMPAGDFLRFITTFKYLNSKLWPVESQEIYHSLDQKEWLEAIDKAGLKLEFQALVNNDLGLWNEHLELIGQSNFPYKSILFVASKKYLYSEYDYFC